MATSLGERKLKPAKFRFKIDRIVSHHARSEGLGKCIYIYMYFHVCVCVCVDVCVCHQICIYLAGFNRRSIFKLRLPDLNSNLSLSKTVALPLLKNPICQNWRRKRWMHTFPWCISSIWKSNRFVQDFNSGFGDHSWKKKTATPPDVTKLGECESFHVILSVFFLYKVLVLRALLTLLMSLLILGYLSRRCLMLFPENNMFFFLCFCFYNQIDDQIVIRRIGIFLCSSFS